MNETVIQKFLAVFELYKFYTVLCASSNRYFAENSR